MLRRLTSALLSLATLSACGDPAANSSDVRDGAIDARSDASTDVPTDARFDSAFDASTVDDAESDAGDVVDVIAPPSDTGVSPSCALPPVPACAASTLPAPALREPGELRGVFWKQWKDPGGADHLGIHYPGDFGFDRSSLIRYVVEAGEVNTIVVDMNELDADQDFPGLGRFIAELYRVQRCLHPGEAPRIHVYLHERAYFHWTNSPSEDPKFDRFATDIAQSLAAVRALDPAAVSIIEGVRWGENGDDDMVHHLRNATYLARRINNATNDWLLGHAFIANGMYFGTSFNGIVAADTALDYDNNTAGTQSFADAIRRQVGTFAWAYKHYWSDGNGGIGVLFANYCTQHGLSQTDPASWRAMFHDLFGFTGLGQWLTAHADRPHIANVVYIGDSGDAYNRTSTEAGTAIGGQMATWGQHGRVFFLPFGLMGNDYYSDATVTTWLEPSPSDPHLACARNSPGLAIWRTLVP